MKAKKTKSGVEISETFGMKKNDRDVTWVMIADRSHARIFRHDRATKSLGLIRDFPHPEGKMKGSDQMTDRPGRAFDSHSQASGGHQTYFTTPLPFEPRDTTRPFPRSIDDRDCQRT